MTSQDWQKKSELRIFLSYFRPHWKLFVLDLVCALAISAIDLAFPFVSRWCMYTPLPEHAWQTFWIVMGIVLGAYVLRSVFSYIIWFWGHRFGVLVEADIRRDLFQHIQSLSYRFFDQNRIGQLMSRLTSDLFDISELAHHGPEDLFVSAVTIVGAIVIMFTIEWRLALVIAVMVPVFLGVVWLCRRSMWITSIQVKRTTGAISADFESALSGIKTAKAFANEQEELRKFSKANESYKYAKVSYHRAMARFNSTMEFFMCILSAVVIAVGVSAPVIK